LGYFFRSKVDRRKKKGFKKKKSGFFDKKFLGVSLLGFIIVSVVSFVLVVMLFIMMNMSCSPNCDSDIDSGFPGVLISVFSIGVVLVRLITLKKFEALKVVKIVGVLLVVLALTYVVFFMKPGLFDVVSGKADIGARIGDGLSEAILVAGDSRETAEPVFIEGFSCYEGNVIDYGINKKPPINRLYLKSVGYSVPQWGVVTYMAEVGVDGVKGITKCGGRVDFDFEIRCWVDAVDSSGYECEVVSHHYQDDTYYRKDMLDGMRGGPQVSFSVDECNGTHILIDNFGLVDAVKDHEVTKFHGAYPYMFISFSTVPVKIGEVLWVPLKDASGEYHSPGGFFTNDNLVDSDEYDIYGTSTGEYEFSC